jgi:hypothetical protein
MPSLVGNYVAANYLKTEPSTQFGTRQLSVLNIAIDGVFVNHADSDSLFSKSVRALQQTAEVWAVFTPVDAGTDSFNVIIATDTQWTGTGAPAANTPAGQLTDGSYTALETAIALGNGGVAATVSAPAGFVAPFHG